MEWKPLPIGVDNFENLITKGYYFIDKTLFIRDLLDMKGEVNLFTRPRRFGKTLNMSMLRYFFEIGEDNEELFAGTKIMSAGEKYRNAMGQFPVVSLSLKSMKQPSYELSFEMLKKAVREEYARHWKTGEPMPQELIDKIQASRLFNQGFTVVEFMSAALLDMAYHSIRDTARIDAEAFEKATLDRIGLIPEITVRYRSPYFSHIFNGGYAAGYYVYTWAEVLDADAFAAFKETGDIFNPEKARAFREYILSRGGSDDPMKLYQAFRGKEPSIDPLLRRKGLLHD